MNIIERFFYSLVDFDVDFKTAPRALRRGFALVSRPKATWALVAQEETTWVTLLMNYTMWWVLWAELGATAINMAFAALQSDGPDWMKAVADSGWANAFQALGGVMAWFAVMGLVTLPAWRFVNAQRQMPKLSFLRALQLVAHGMTPMLLLAPLLAVPGIFVWILLIGLGWSLYCARQGFQYMTSLDSTENTRITIRLMFGSLIAVPSFWIFAAIGWIFVLPVIFALVNIKIMMMLAPLNARLNKRNQQEQDSVVPAKSPSISSPNSPPNSEFTFPDEQPEALTGTRSQATASPIDDTAHAAELAKIDKKIAEATAQGDMARLSELMGERSQLQQNTK